MLACLVAIECFREKIQGRLVILYSDSTNAVTWLKKSRALNIIGARYLSIWELRKFKSACKVSPRWIPGEKIQARMLCKGERHLGGCVNAELKSFVILEGSPGVPQMLSCLGVKYCFTTYLFCNYSKNLRWILGCLGLSISNTIWYRVLRQADNLAVRTIHKKT